VTSTVPQPTLGATGYTAPEEADILAAVQIDISTAFGGTLSTGLSTPQGQLASSLSAIIADKNAMFLSFVAQTDPQYAQGRMQDAIGRIYFLDRIPSRPTSVSCTCNGLEGVVIPANALAKDQGGNIYFCVLGGVIGPTGSLVLTFNNTVNGPTPCPAGTLDTIYVMLAGWDSITNLADGTLGTTVETAQEFETRRQLSVATNAQGSLPSIYAAVAASGENLIPPNIPLDLYVTQNVMDTEQEIGGVLVKPHSVYVAAMGGDPASIATAIWKKASLGCSYTGSTDVVVEDSTGYSIPYPSYTISYQVPISWGIKFSVTIAANRLLPADYATLIKNAIVAAFAGSDGGSKARIGTSIYASRYYAPVTACAPGVEIVSILVGHTTANANNVAIQIDQIPTISASDIQVAVI